MQKQGMETVALPDSACSQMSKPAATEACNTQLCLARYSIWKSGNLVQMLNNKNRSIAYVLYFTAYIECMTFGEWNTQEYKLHKILSSRFPNISNFLKFPKFLSVCFFFKSKELYKKKEVHCPFFYLFLFLFICHHLSP